MSILGFIGTGNMGGALARAAAKRVEGCDLLLANRTPGKAEALASELGASVVSNREAAARSDYIFLGVKPQMMMEVMSELTPVLAARKDRCVLVSMAAGLTTDKIRMLAGGRCPVIRIMPNTPAAIGQGMILYCTGGGVSDEELTRFLDIMQSAGRFSALSEHLIDAGSAVTGCGPAFVDLFVEALADGGVACGLPRVLALEYAAQMTAGAAQLILDSGKHPGQLKDEVCSPGGTTIQGVRTLEERAFRAAVTDAVIAAWEKTKKLV